MKAVKRNLSKNLHTVLDGAALKELADGGDKVWNDIDSVSRRIIWIFKNILCLT